MWLQRDACAAEIAVRSGSRASCADARHTWRQVRADAGVDRLESAPPSSHATARLSVLEPRSPHSLGRSAHRQRGLGLHPSFWATIRFPDVNGDGKADVCGRGRACSVRPSTGTGFGASRPGAALHRRRRSAVTPPTGAPCASSMSPATVAPTSALEASTGCGAPSRRGRLPPHRHQLEPVVRRCPGLEGEPVALGDAAVRGSRRRQEARRVRAHERRHAVRAVFRQRVLEPDAVVRRGVGRGGVWHRPPTGSPSRSATTPFTGLRSPSPGSARSASTPSSVRRSRPTTPSVRSAGPSESAQQAH